MKHELVKDWMTSDVVTITPNTSLSAAHRLMTDNNIRRLPVVKKKRLVGMVTRGDVRGAEPSEASTLSIWEINYLLAHLKIKSIMSPDPLTVSPSTTIEDAADVMLQHKVSGLPVVNNKGNIVGIITESDIFRLVVASWRQD